MSTVDERKCKHGHELTAENVYAWRGERICRACRAETNRRHRSQKRSGT